MTIHWHAGSVYPPESFCPCGVWLPGIEEERECVTVYVITFRPSSSLMGFNRSFCPECTAKVMGFVAALPQGEPEVKADK